MVTGRELYINFVNAREPTILSKLPQSLFAEVVSYLDIYSIRWLIQAFLGLSKRFVLLSGFSEYGCRLFTIPTVKRIVVGNYADDDLLDIKGERLVVILTLDDSMKLGAPFISGETTPVFKRLLNALRPYDTVRIVMSEKHPFCSELIRTIRTLAKVRIHCERYTEYIPTRSQKMVERQPGASALTSITSFDQSPLLFKHDEYASSHVLTHMNSLQNKHYSNMTSLLLWFGKNQQRPVISGIYAPKLLLLEVYYADKFPLFYDNDFGSQWERNMLTIGFQYPELKIMQQDDTYVSSTHPIPQSSLMSPEEMDLCDFSWSRFFRRVKIHGGPDDLVRLLDFSETEVFVWRRSCFQHPESSPVLQLNTPCIEHFSYDDLLPAPSVPVLIGATRLKGVMVAAHQPGLQLNGLLKDKNLEWANIYSYSAAKGPGFDMVIGEDDLWNVDCNTKVILFGCGAVGHTERHGVVELLNETTNPLSDCMKEDLRNLITNRRLQLIGTH